MQGTPRSLIPVAFGDLSKWPAPDISVFDAEVQEKYKKRKQAIEMYALNESFGAIKDETKNSESEVRRLIRRCVTPDGWGNIYGFNALINGVRVNPYIRRAPVVSQPFQHGGSSGALGQLLAAYPGVKSFIEERFFKDSKSEIIHEARISYRDLHKQFIKHLRALGFTNDQWPFTSETRGYNSLVKYCNDLLTYGNGVGMAQRCGKEASRRSSVGQGQYTLIPVLRPYSMVQLDFHKVDAASIIVLENDYGEEIEIPVSRWHIGLLAEEYSKSILGIYVSLETTPSGDCVLETIDSALNPEELHEGDIRRKYVHDGKVVISQILPEFKSQCFSALKIDNAWAHSSTEVLNNIIDTVGCAVNFGPVRAWWRRPLIERIFGELTRKGLQRMPSTFGIGPSDTCKDDPYGKAAKFRIPLSELVAIIYGCVRRFNERTSEGLQSSSPVSVLKAALTKNGSHFFTQPLAKPAQSSNNLMMHVVEATVRGSIKKNVRPSIKTHRWRYTNTMLSQAYYLVGKKLVVYISRRDPRLAYATVKETGEQLGQLKPEAAKQNTRCSLRVVNLLNKHALNNAHQDESIDPVEEWGRQTKQELFANRKRGSKDKVNGKPAARAALDLLRAENTMHPVWMREQISETEADAMNSDSEESFLDEEISGFSGSPVAPLPETKPPLDPFGLDISLTLNSIDLDD